MRASIAYGVILERETHDEILNKLLTSLPEHEQKLLYLDISEDEFGTYTDEQKCEVATLDIETLEFKDKVLTTLNDREVIYYYIIEKYPLLSVNTTSSVEWCSAILVGRSQQFLEEYSLLVQEGFSSEELGQLNAAITELELNLTPQWFYWRY